VALAAAALAVAETWPLATRLGTHFAARPTVTAATSDQLLCAWILASDVRRLGRDPLRVFETNNLHPFHRTLAYSENLLGLAVPIAPVQALSDDPVLAYNVAMLFAIALSAWGVALLVHELTGSAAAAVVGAALATHSPTIVANLDELHVVAGLATPLALFALVRLVRTRAWRWTVALGVLVAWQAWASLHWGVFLALGLAAGVPLLVATSADARRVLPRLAAAGLLAGLLVVPLVLPYEAVSREMDLTDRGFVAFLWSPWAPFAPLAHPWAFVATRLANGARGEALAAFTPWLAAAAGLVAGAVARRPRTVDASCVAAIAAAAFAGWWYALGPRGWYGHASLYEALATTVPGLGILRAPARALYFSAVMAAVLGGCGLAALLARLRTLVGRAVVVTALLGCAVVEAGWKPLRLVPAPTRAGALAAALDALPPGCAVADLPTDFDRDGVALFRSTAHWRPLLNGRSGFFPVSSFVAAGFLNQFPSDRTLAYLRAAGACAVILHLDHPQGAAMFAATLRRALPVTTGRGEALVRVPPGPAEPADDPPLPRVAWRVLEPPDGAGTLLDGSLATRRSFAVAEGPAPERLTVDLGAPAALSGVDLELGAHFRSYLLSYRVEGSTDGTAWTTIAEEPFAVPPFASYRADPARVVQRLRFPPTRVRFLRVGPSRRPPTGLAVDVGFATWAAAELQVRGVPAE